MTNNKPPKVKRTERGWAGHFICSHKCRFHLNTLLEYKSTKIVISTVGMMITNNKPEEIGCDKYYETMAFYAKQEDEFVEMDVERPIEFDNNWVIDEPYKDNEANEMHENVVQEIINKIKEL